MSLKLLKAAFEFERLSYNRF